MALVPMKEIMVEARRKGYALGAFEFWSLDSAQAVAEAASQMELPIILQVGPLEAQYAGSFEALSTIAKFVAGRVKIPIALHLDHAEEFEMVEDALKAGFTSVMIDASAKSFDENVEITLKTVKAARKFGASVESELGRLAGNEGNISTVDEQAFQTDPDEAADFVEKTGIDALAVAIGTAHGFYRFPPKLNLERLKNIAARVSVPLVLHGGSGTPDDQVVEAIRLGIAKVNICTEFVAAFGRQYMATQETPGFKYNVPALFRPSKEAGKQIALQKIKLFSGQKNL